MEGLNSKNTYIKGPLNSSTKTDQINFLGDYISANRNIVLNFSFIFDKLKISRNGKIRLMPDTFLAPTSKLKILMKTKSKTSPWLQYCQKF